MKTSMRPSSMTMGIETFVSRTRLAEDLVEAGVQAELLRGQVEPGHHLFEGARGIRCPGAGGRSSQTAGSATFVSTGRSLHGRRGGGSSRMAGDCSARPSEPKRLVAAARGWRSLMRERRIARRIAGRERRATTGSSRRILAGEEDLFEVARAPLPDPRPRPRGQDDRAAGTTLST